MTDNQPLPTLYVFSISHYCEKARWALDAGGISYRSQCLMPGKHMEIMAELGAPGSSLPLLAGNGTKVHGSGAILDWVDTQNGSGKAPLAPSQDLATECHALEQRLDDRVGVHARRYFYSEALVEHPDTVLPIFSHDLPEDDAQTLKENWPLVCELMTARMDLGHEQGQESRAILETELDWLDSLLVDQAANQQAEQPVFLIGDQFSRADITAASLLAPLALPPEHPTYSMLQVPPRASIDMDRWKERPIARWVGDMYRQFRY